MAEVDLTRFIDFVSNFHPSIKFTSVVSSVSVNFLDISVSLGPTGIHTSVFYKPTASHCYLLYSSSHPRTCRDSLPFSQLLRLRRLCQDDDDFHHQAHLMLDFFRHRLYPEDVLQSALQRVCPISRLDALSPSPKSSSERPIFALSFHPHNLAVPPIIHRHLPILLSDPTTRQVFPDPPLVAFRRDKNLRDLLVRSRLCPNRGGPLGTIPCQRPCKTCPFVWQTDSVDFPKSTFQIRRSFSCISRNVIYALFSRRCNMAYIGETGRILGDRFREHLRDIKNREAKPVPSHFNSPGHRGSKDILVTAIVACHSDDSSRLSLENRLISRLGTLAPAGMNIQHSYC